MQSVTCLLLSQRLLIFAAVAIMSGISCAAPVARAGRDADASVAVVRAEMRELNAGLLQVRSELHAGGDVNQNDKWTLRLLGVGVLVMGLTYPVGKIIWIATSAVARRGFNGASSGNVTSKGQTASSGVGTDEFLALRDKCAHRADLSVPA